MGPDEHTAAHSPNDLTEAAMRIEPRLKAFANSLNSEKWQMTGSGSAFFLRCANEEEAQAATARLKCWTAVAQSVGAWA